MRQARKEQVTTLWNRKREAFVAYNTEVDKTLKLLELPPEEVDWAALERQQAREHQAFDRYRGACKSLQAAIFHEEKIAA